MHGPASVLWSKPRHEFSEAILHMKMASNRKNNTRFTLTTFRAYEVKVPLIFRLEAVFMVKTAPEKGHL